jgi:hypothetical protein
MTPLDYFTWQPLDARLSLVMSTDVLVAVAELAAVLVAAIAILVATLDSSIGLPQLAPPIKGA